MKQEQLDSSLHICEIQIYGFKKNFRKIFAFVMHILFALIIP